jgi:hypothetical protein
MLIYQLIITLNHSRNYLYELKLEVQYNSMIELQIFL